MEEFLFNKFLKTKPLINVIKFIVFEDEVGKKIRPKIIIDHLSKTPNSLRSKKPQRARRKTELNIIFYIEQHYKYRRAFLREDWLFREVFVLFEDFPRSTRPYQD